jgi:hypothetical protein
VDHHDLGTIFLLVGLLFFLGVVGDMREGTFLDRVQGAREIFGGGTLFAVGLVLLIW